MAKNKNPFMGMVDIDVAQKSVDKFIDKWNKHVDKKHITDHYYGSFVRGFLAAMTMCTCTEFDDMYGTSPFKYMKNAWKYFDYEHNELHRVLEMLEELRLDDDDDDEDEDITDDPFNPEDLLGEVFNKLFGGQKDED